MRRMLLAAFIVHLPQASAAEALENAYFVCDIFERTGMSSECRVSNITSSVEVMIEIDQAEARNVCAVIVKSMAEKKRVFGGQWKLRIYHPQRADTPLAACDLR